MQRGTTIDNGSGNQGIYVGKSPNGVEWVAWDAADFPKMCERFDARFAPTAAPTGRVRNLSLGVTDLASDLLSVLQESEPTEVANVIVGATFVDATSDFFDALADRVADEADDRESGDKSVAHECYSVDMSWRQAEALDRRIARSLRKHCRRLRAAAERLA
jgi:hypothetical protein